jgi:hypothetical protein
MDLFDDLVPPLSAGIQPDVGQRVGQNRRCDERGGSNKAYVAGLQNVICSPVLCYEK